MRILMLSDVYHPRVNGVSTSISTFRRFLEAAGHHVTLIAPQYPGDNGLDDDTLRVPGYYLPGDPEDRLLLPGRILKLKPRLETMHFDVVHVHTPFAAHRAGVRLACALGIPVVETYHTYFEAYFHHYIPFLPQRLLEFIARRLTLSQADAVDRLIVPSTALQKVMRDYGVRTTVEVLPTGLDLDEFSPGNRLRFCQRHRLDPKRPMLVYVGRVAFEKNIDLLLRVVVRLRLRHPDVLLIIAGEGPALGHLKRSCRELGIAGNVHFVGYLKRGGDLWDCYAAGRAFVFASTTETQGLVLLEAMALGVPVVGVPALGARDVLIEGEGALTAPAEVDAFTAAVQRLLEDESLHRELSERARVYAARWSNVVMCERLIGIYQTVVEEQLRVGADGTAAKERLNRQDAKVAENA
ncbi:MAG: glycosyltransferase [Gammaproteobacteria bacterium]|nr:glycosyltransferase [Gammaproteobacteria bacterium]